MSPTPPIEDRRILAPAKDARIRKPDATLLADGGEEVVMSTYWRRLIDQGDVVDKTPAARPATGKADA